MVPDFPFRGVRKATFYRRYLFHEHVITDAPANHSSPYDYDRHVPLIFLGAGVTRGLEGNEVHTTDVAPTLAALGGIVAPTDIDGRDLIGRGGH